MEHRQSPCPHRCFEDLGAAYAMGLIGGSAWHGIKGARNAPVKGRCIGAYQQIVMRAPALGGNFAVWGGLFSVFDCSMIALRKKEDPLNAITAGFMTGGILSARAGAGACLQSAMVGGVLLGLIEGVGFLFGRGAQHNQHQGHVQPAPMLPGMSAVGQGQAQTMATMQPRRSRAQVLEEHEMSEMEEEDISGAGSFDGITSEHAKPSILSSFTSMFRSSPSTINDTASSSSSSSLSSPIKLSSPLKLTSSSSSSSSPYVHRVVPLYTSAPEFSSDDFTFNDSEDFDDEN